MRAADEVLPLEAVAGRVLTLVASMDAARWAKDCMSAVRGGSLSVKALIGALRKLL
jgi:hypothetical protein